MKTKQIIFGITLFLGLSVVVNAQTKIGVGILPFTYVSSAASKSDVNSIQESVTNSFVKTKRFNIVDRTKIDALKDEKELQKSEDFIDGSVIQQGISLGANYLISGHVISAQADRMEAKDDKGNITMTYKAKLSVSLKVIDVSTGQVIASETIEPKSGNAVLGMIGIGSSTPDVAISKAVKGIQEKIDKFVATNFPISFAIAEIQDGSKILIAGGTGFGLKKGDKLTVFEVSTMEVNGKQLSRKKEIGILKITKVEDENFSTCSISSGSSDIISKFGAKANLQVLTLQ